MNEKEIGFIMQKMSGYLDNSPLMRLEQTLEDTIKGAEIIPCKSSEALLTDFLSVKRLEGRSELTLSLYQFNIGKMIQKIPKDVCVMDTDDIRQYLADYHENNVVCKATVDNVRPICLAFSNGLRTKAISTKVLCVESIKLNWQL